MMIVSVTTRKLALTCDIGTRQAAQKLKIREYIYNFIYKTYEIQHIFCDY